MRAPFPIENKNPQRVMLCGSFNHDLDDLKGACASNTPAVAVADHATTGQYTLTLAEAPSQVDCVILTCENSAEAFVDFSAHAIAYTAATGVLEVFVSVGGSAADLGADDRLNFLIVHPKFSALADQ